MSITKDQWAAVEAELKRPYGRCDFSVDGNDISVQREGYSEGRTCLVVYINGSWTFGWGSPESDKFRPITTLVWRKRSNALYKPKQKASLIKAFGGVRKTRERFPKLDKVSVRYEPIFFKASALVRQLRRIPTKDIRLGRIGHGYPEMIR